ncbi:hypothetical protein B0T25DRAFT_217899 [Lasiosphaeria hispida]|uniref:HTH APSES-type domain-containing protein n=1 Tax=Lasiosphaeria hispida TaxID=260671 RepID=A0AAJ0HJD7_9PEZI|nr:hypothetical protein B0T25DRAFT_217899 [Lasiosphaeria hispida]
MLSLASLLNPDPSRAPLPTSRPALCSPVPQAISLADESVQTAQDISRSNMDKESKGLGKSRARGVVNFYPFEDLDEASLQHIRQFRVQPFGTIRDSSRRIPYNSGKKDFYQKTGRESFEVFHYDFRLPDEETVYTVMWDYTVGLVRMTPFFKCCRYSKTTPAKMLNQNPGLRDITHSITGGAIKAQGYWMPFACAKAVCATFCYNISGALIPIFGPGFPSECVTPDIPNYARMVIDPAIISASTREADRFHHMYTTRSSPPTPRLSGSISPLPPRRHHRMADSYDYSADDEFHRRFRKGMFVDSPYGTGTDTDVDMYLGPEIRGRYGYAAMPPARSTGMPPSMAVPRSTDTHSPVWAPVVVTQQPPPPQHIPNHFGEEISSATSSPRGTPNPWLTAIPRLPSHYDGCHLQYNHPRPPPPMLQDPPVFAAPARRRHRPGKRNFGHANVDDEYDAGESQYESSPGGHGARDEGEEYGETIASQSPNGVETRSNRPEAEKDAALMLMNLRVRGPSWDKESRDGMIGSPDGMEPSPQLPPLAEAAASGESHRVKRRRATLV